MALCKKFRECAIVLRTGHKECVRVCVFDVANEIESTQAGGTAKHWTAFGLSHSDREGARPMK